MNGKAEQSGSLDAENVCGADAARFLAAQVTLVVKFKMENKDKLNLFISLSALTVAALSLWFSYSVYKYEELSLQLMDDHLHEDYVTTIRKGDGKRFPALIDKLYKATLINDGGNTINIVNINGIHRLDSPPWPFLLGTTYILNDAVLDENKEQVNFPITLKPGDSIVVFLVASINLEAVIYDTLKDRYPINSTGYFDKISRHAWEQGKDLYGNSVHVKKTSQVKSILSVKQKI